MSVSSPIAANATDNRSVVAVATQIFAWAGMGISEQPHS